jgi:ABC-type Fe3+ transport system substrate-binding protein
MRNNSGQFKVGRRTLLKAALALGAAQVAGPFLTSGAARAQAPGAADIATFRGADREQRLLEGAKKEGTLTIYTSATVQDVAALTAAFQTKYGITPTVWRASADDIVQRAVNEARGGRFEVDLFETNGPEVEALQRENLLRQLKSPAAAQLAPGAVAPDRQWIADRLQLWAQAYNTESVKKADLPRSYEDLLDPKWKGKLGIEATDVDWFQATVTALGEDRGLQLFRQIVAKNGISVRKGHTLLTNLVAAGEIPLALTTYLYKAKQLKEQGAPLDWFVIPPQIGRFQGIGLARRAPHPYAAVLFSDWLLTEGQPILARRDMLPANVKVQPLPDFPLRFVDPAQLLDQRTRWEKLYNEIVVTPGS